MANRGLDAYKNMLLRNREKEVLEKVTVENAVGALSKGAPPNKTPPNGAPPQFAKTGDEATLREAEPKVRRVAKFLILIGSENAAKILAELDENQIEDISKEISSIKGISSDEAAAIFDEFHSLLSGNWSYGGAPQGGVDEARKLLYAAFGPDRGEDILRKAVPETSEKIFSFLEDFSAEQISAILKDESPAAAALVLSRIDPKLSAQVIASQNEFQRSEVVRRIAKLTRVSPEILEKVAQGLREKARNLGGITTTTFDGAGALAAILKHTDISFGDRILDELSYSDIGLSQTIKEKLFTLEDVIKSENKPIQEKLHHMSEKDIAILIKGRPEPFKEKILSNVSSNRRDEIQAELDFMGPILKRDSQAAMKEFMDWFRNARENGKILISGDEYV